MSYLGDILEQPEILRSVTKTYKDHPAWQQLRLEVTGGRYQKVVLTGMGGSYNSLFPTWLHLNHYGIPAIHIEASELVHYAPAMLSDRFTAPSKQRALFIVVSQSGESIEIRRLLEIAQDQVDIISITNNADNHLARHSKLSLPTYAGAEVGVATKTYTSGLALLHLLSRSLTGQYQPQDHIDLLTVADCLDQLLMRWSDWIAPAVKQLQPATFFSFLGRGPAVATAMNSALIFKEAVRLPAVGLSGGQFRHGPMEALSPKSGIVVFAPQGRTWDLNLRLAQDIAERGGRVVLVGLESSSANIVNLPLPVVDEFLSPILEILATQLLAAKFAEQHHIVPGQFRWSGKVINRE